LQLLPIDAGAEDFESFDSILQIFSPPDRLEEIRSSLSDKDAPIVSSELSLIPTTTVALDEKVAVQALRLLDQLEELDDVQRVYSNADFPDEVLQQYSAEN
ncbi:MAG: YebC/PmpR family DNA-binding transcriptional regulator, partial [Chloroflexi bacterium]|nr:YebC/PmpR family DNA-binding transcriptional regulator [Chloroflexota bacterium]